MSLVSNASISACKDIINLLSVVVGDGLNIFNSDELLESARRRMYFPRINFTPVQISRALSIVSANAYISAPSTH